MLVTTTNTLQGIDIKRYIKPVSAHIVAGTGFLSDFGASFSDIFGGRSSTYQRQLQSLYDDAISKLKQNAAQVGGNCIIGLNIDMDEISGKGKAMFMVTATGTAVIIDQPAPESKTHKEVVTTEFYDSTYSLIIELNKLEKDKNYYTPVDKLTPLLDSGVEDAIDLLINNIKIASKEGIDLREDFKSKAVSFLRRMPLKVIIDRLYQSLIEADKVHHIETIKWYIESAGLIDLETCKVMIKSGDRAKMRTALKVIVLKKESFSSGDIDTYQQLTELIQQEFTEVGRRSTKKGGILSKDKEVWDCPCGKEGNTEQYCSNCGNDTYGFRLIDLKLEKAISILNDRVEVLNFIFK